MKYVGRVLSAFGLMVAICMPLSTSAAVDVNNFVISDYTIDMQLSRDAQQRSVLKTTETITAQFPSIDQNHGLERAIPMSYDGHKTSLEVVAVTDQKGTERPYTTYDDSHGNLVVRMADMDTFVHGTQVYRLTYTQHDVTRYFADTNDDEFYWDTNGTDWRVPITRLQTTITLDDTLLTRLTDRHACYKGAAGSTDRCTMSRDGQTYSALATNLAPGENATVVIGFQPQTFSAYQMSAWETLLWLWGLLQAGIGIISIGIGFWLIRKYLRASNRDDELGSIAPEYLPPPNASVTVSSRIARTTAGSAISAQIIDFAVRHYIKLYEVKEKKWYKAGEYEIEIIRDPLELRAEEQELLSDMFGHLPTVGEKLNLKKLQNNTAYGRRLMDNDAKLGKSLKEQYGLRHIDTTKRKAFRKIALVLLLLGIVLFGSVPLLMSALLAFIFSMTLTPLTDDGLALRRYLEGLKLYIGVAETERLKMLQSPEGAEKVAPLTSDTSTASIVKLYERVLPYAILFGQEKEWTKQLGVYYEQNNSQPDWYVGQSVFNAAVFSSALGGLSSATSYASSSSSSSGGSGGGGFSGGGGGGGGGGGV